jgi:sugar lactone lactonase YvrE
MLVCFFANAQTITTYAGNGLIGFAGDNDIASNAEVSNPMGLNFDLSGNLLICANVLIRKVNVATTIISTIAGSDTATNQGGNGDGGPALAADMFDPYAICIDKAGNYYIADYYYSEVRKVDILSGIIDTFAGCRIAGNSGDGGPAKKAKFGSGISSICIDTMHNYMYISDEWNHRVRRVDMSTGIIDAFAGTGINSYSGDSGLAINATFSRILGVCTDQFGNVYIGDWDNARIRKVDFVTGIVTTIAGNGTTGYSGDNGLAINANISKPTAICIDKDGNLYFSDETNQRVRKVESSTGIITTVAGNGTAGFSGDGNAAVNASLNHPSGICIDSSYNLFVSDFNNHRVRKITLGETIVKEIPTNDAVGIYPNPTKDQLMVTVNRKLNEVTVLNALGQVLMEQKNYNSNKAVINVSGLAAGVYFVKVSGRNGAVVTKRFVKE